MVDPTIVLAAGRFAGRFAAQWAGDALKRQSIENAYSEAAEAAINECEQRGHHARPAVWNEVVGLLGNVTKVERALRQVRQSGMGQRPRVFARCSPEARELVWWFVACLNERLREELPPKDRVVVDLILAGQAGLAERIDNAIRFGRLAGQLMFHVEPVPVRVAYREPQLELSLREMLADWIGKDSDGLAAEEFMGEQQARFWTGDSQTVCRRANVLRSLIVESKLVHEKKGKRWLAAASAVLAQALTHAMPPAYLKANPGLPRTELDKALSLVGNDDPIVPHLRGGWGALMRIVGELTGSSERLLESLKERKEGLSALSESDPFRVQFHAELMATAADIEILHPNLLHSLRENGNTWQDHYERARGTAASLGGTALLYAMCPEEFKVRWALWRIMTARVRGCRATVSDRELQDMLKGIADAKTSVERAGGKAGILAINLAVTEVNIYRVAGRPTSEEVIQKARDLVDRHQDVEQSYRLTPNGLLLPWA